MNRKQMLETIAAQSRCSLRHVRKEVFKRAAYAKRHYPKIKLNEALSDKAINWVDRNTLKGREKFATFNTFDVGLFESGFVVLFYVKEEDDNLYPEPIGVRLTTIAEKR